MESNDLDEAIKRVGGGDEAYRVKLKEQVREAMGYSNYMRAGNKAMGKDIDISAMKGNITPAGVKNIVGAGISNRQNEADTQFGIAGAYDGAADKIAGKRIADAKASAAKKKIAQGIENGVAFEPQDHLDEKILESYQSPYNDDGSVKSQQQMDAEIMKYFADGNASEDEGYVGPQPSAEEIQSRLHERMPDDFGVNQDKYTMMLQGHSEKYAETNAGLTSYRSKKPVAQLMWRNQHQDIAGKLDKIDAMAQVVTEGMATDVAIDKDGNKIDKPRWTYSQIVERNPELSPAEVKERVGARYKQEAANEIDTLMSDVKGKKTDTNLWMDWLAFDDDVTGYDAAKAVYEGKANKDTADGKGITGLKKMEIFTEIKNTLQTNYTGLIPSGELDAFITNYIISKM